MSLHKGISLHSMQPGDVLLCRSVVLTGIARKISKETGSKYTHAAICIEGGKAAGASPTGIELESIEELVRAFDHVAVFRQPDAWSPRRRRTLTAFANAAAASGSPYNFAGLKAFKKEKQFHEDNLHEKLTAYFAGEFQAPSPAKDDPYTCSEFVAACFLITGIVEPSAAVMYDPAVISPGELGRDPTWGTFVGYCSVKPGYAIPIDDEFYNEATYAEIFENEP